MLDFSGFLYKYSGLWYVHAIIIHWCYRMQSFTQSQKYLLISFTLAGVVTLLLYPGWLYFDSVFQWKWAALLLKKGWPDKLSDLGITTHWPLFNTVIRMPFYAITGGAGLYIWCQAALVFFSVYLLGRCLITDNTRLAILYAVVCALPNMINLSVLHASDILLASLYIMLIAQFWQYSLGLKTPASYWPIAGTCTAMIIAQLLRNNTSVTTFFVLPVFLWPLFPMHSYRKTAIALLLALTIAVPVSINSYLNKTAHFSTSSTQGIALRLWIQSLTYRSEMAENVLSRIKLREDEDIDPTCYTRGIWCQQLYSSLDAPAIALNPSLQKPLAKAYIFSFLESPLEWWDANLPIMAAFSGIGSQLNDECVGRYDSMSNIKEKDNLGIRMVPNGARNLMLYWDQQTAWLGFGHPIYLLLVNLILAAWLAFRLRDFDDVRLQIMVLFYVTLAYIAPIILAAPDPQERYYYPFTIPHIILCVAMLLRLPETFKKAKN